MTGKTVVLLPTYNERKNIALIVPEIFHSNPTLHVLVIDDSSPDGTAQEVRSMMRRYPNLALLLRPSKQGLGEAYKAGILQVLADLAVDTVVMMDADGSHSAEYLPGLLAASERHELVIGSRYVHGGGIENWERWRYLLSQSGNFYARTIAGLPVRDLTAGFMCFRADLLRKIDFFRVQASGYAFLMELKFCAIHMLKASLMEVPIIFKARREGESKISRHIIREGLKTPWRLFYRRWVNDPLGVHRAVEENPRCMGCGSASDFFARKAGYMLYTCRACGLTFVSPVPDSAAVYGEDYFSGATGGHGYVDYDADKEPMTPTFEEYLKRIRHLSGGNRILDVGAATGFFLQIAQRSGFDAYGVEISSYAAQRATEKGIPMITGTLADVPAEPLFDVITLLDVIEHVGNPEAELLRANALLQTDGLLVINTPDIGSLYARLMGKKWHLIVPPEHLVYFDRATMRALLEKTGFTVLSISTVGKRFTLQYIFKMLYMWQGFRLWKHLSGFCGRTWLRCIALPINLRDNMFVMARKESSRSVTY